MSARAMLPKWGHWFWITILMVALSGPCNALGRGAVIGANPVGVQPYHGIPVPVPVFIRSDAISDEHIMIVTPSSVVKNPEIPVTTGFEPRRTGLGRSKQLEDVETSSKTEDDPTDVSVSKSVSVVSVKYSLSGDRARHEDSRRITDTSIPPPPPPQPQQQQIATSPSTTTTTVTSTTSSAPNDSHLIQQHKDEHHDATTATTTTTSPTITTTTSTTTSPKTTTTSAATTTVSHQVQERGVLNNQHSELKRNTQTTLKYFTTTTTTTDTTASPVFTTTAKVTTASAIFTPTTTPKASFGQVGPFSSNLGSSSTPKFDVPIINHPQPPKNFEGDTKEEEEDEMMKEVRNEKSLFAFEQNSKMVSGAGGVGGNQDEKVFDSSFTPPNWPPTTTTTTGTTTTRRTSPPATPFTTMTTTTARPSNERGHVSTTPNLTAPTTTARTTTTTHSTTTVRSTTTATATRPTFTTSTTTMPQKIYIQEVEEISVEEIDEVAASSQMERKALHSNVPNSRQLYTQPGDEKAGAFDRTSQSSQRYETTETSESSKMVVEYLEEAELARSFPSTKWNVYEDKDGTWYLQKTATRSSPRPESRHSESPLSRNDSASEYDELPRVVDVGESVLTLPDIGDSDRDEEPYEKFMAEESGKPVPGPRNGSNDEYFEGEAAKDEVDDDLTPTYDEKNYTDDDADTSHIEPRMLSTAQKTVNAIHQKREDEVIDEWGHQPRVRKPAISIDIATVVGITVGAFLFILIGTVGLGAFIYHEKYMNKPQTLEDRYSSSDSDGSSVDDPYHRISQIDCVGFDTTRDTFCEEMYNLDNDSFLNSLETVNVPSTSYWIHDARNVDSDV